ncbi:4'-phosphopantetheinyl transferase family protein [Solibacillus isronensis]|uniref:4'-phosphopantetheinyl transferase family protein n=1 Tax=Solibacillus isronensis TaxID=412383 RepID=UPI00203AB710|nr:4'-phosphopantetheinyl transferase superfamily protein [Solibacillus isronensis]MCM3722845.1 4'-phosphopantetheinyl transferase superfamily protein [Solibacillus isronensis]
MTTIAYCKINEMPTDWQRYLPFLENDVVQRIGRMRKTEDRLRTVCAHLLTKMMLVTTYEMELSEIRFTKDSNGKYQLGQDLHFNLSHSGSYVACAISDFPVGIDVEQQVTRDFSLFQTLWSEEENHFYKLLEQEAFYALWTAKESYGKYKGFGLHDSLMEATIRQDGSIHHPASCVKARTIPFFLAPGYSAAVCLEDSLENVTHVQWAQIETFFREKVGTYEKIDLTN